MRSNQGVEAFDERIAIPTHGVGKQEKNPVFLEKRVYRGGGGVVCPREFHQFGEPPSEETIRLSSEHPFTRKVKVKQVSDDFYVSQVARHLKCETRRTTGGGALACSNYFNALTLLVKSD